MTAIENTIRDYFEKIPYVFSVTLFGSYAENRATHSSDIDIAILCDPAKVPNPLEIIDLREELSQHLGRDVDLVCLNTASPIIGTQIVINGKNLLVKNMHVYQNYRILLTSAYAELKMMRAPMEKDILKRKIYDK